MFVVFVPKFILHTYYYKKRSCQFSTFLKNNFGKWGSSYTPINTVLNQLYSYQHPKIATAQGPSVRSCETDDFRTEWHREGHILVTFQKKSD